MASRNLLILFWRCITSLLKALTEDEDEGNAIEWTKGITSQSTKSYSYLTNAFPFYLSIGMTSAEVLGGR